MYGHILTPIIFTSRTLVILKLQNLKIVADNLCFDLPSLKTLVLKGVYFKNQKNDFVKLLNACPILEDLHIYYPRLRIMKRKDNNEVQEFKSLFLSKLVRAYIHSIDVPFDAINNIEYLCIIQDDEERSYGMNIEEHSFEIKIEEASFKGIPVFQNLIRIELWFFSVFRGWDGVVELLRHCPKLQKNFIRKWNTSLSREWNCPISTPECVLSHLRSCTIFHFEGSKDDLQFATYILQNAKLLEVMEINFFIQNYQVIEELSSCPRMSPGCKLSF